MALMAGRNLLGVDRGWAYVAVKGDRPGCILEHCSSGTCPAQRSREKTTALSKLLHLPSFLQQHVELATQTGMHTAPTHCLHRPKSLQSKSLLTASQAFVSREKSDFVAHISHQVLKWGKNQIMAAQESDRYCALIFLQSVSPVKL